MFAILHYAYCNILHSCILQCFATFHIANIAKTRGACIDVMCQLHTHRWGQSYILLQGLSYLLLEVQDFYALHCSPAFPESLLCQWLHPQNYYFTILFALFYLFSRFPPRTQMPQICRNALPYLLVANWSFLGTDHIQAFILRCWFRRLLIWGIFTLPPVCQVVFPLLSL